MLRLVDRFATVSTDYGKFRPMYPISLLQYLSDQFASICAHGGTWIDVGCGTGIFTRQMADRLPDTMRVIGLEPSEPMREQARHGSARANIDYRLGSAEALPIADASACAVSAATAAHWFDRPRFYAEVVRVLKPRGLLAIVEYVRDVDDSPAAAALDAYLNEAAGPKAYGRPDYLVELETVPELEAADIHNAKETFRLDIKSFKGLARSSSHCAKAVARLGEDRVEADLERLARDHLDPDNRIPYGYRFNLLIVRKATLRSRGL